MSVLMKAVGEKGFFWPMFSKDDPTVSYKEWGGGKYRIKEIGTPFAPTK